MISFLLNDTQVTTPLATGSTVLDFVRYHKSLTGTKIGCREGDCGACTILVGSIESGKLKYRSMTSCLMPLGNAHAKHILTVEGINMEQLSPVQKTLEEHNGTQCGFCTIGFIMTLTGFVMDADSRTTEEAITAMDGNICRCTGYKSIERAAEALTQELREKPQDNILNWLVDQAYLPSYFAGVEERLRTLIPEQSPIDKENSSTELRLGGGTDLLVQRPEVIRKAQLDHLFDSQSLKGISVKNNICYVGASTTVTEFAESPLIQSAFPHLPAYIKLVSSTPIRNMATMAGNLVNASPIGDMSIFFLGLDSSIILSKEGQQRQINLRDFFLDYKKLNKGTGEHIESILFEFPTVKTHFNFEKVSKRTHLDIASVNSACHISFAADGSIGMIHLAAGGVAPVPKYLAKTGAYLTGKVPNKEHLDIALEIMQGEVAPISDARGTAAYKRLLLRQLFLAHMLKFLGPIDSIRNVLAL